MRPVITELKMSTRKNGYLFIYDLKLSEDVFSEEAQESINLVKKKKGKATIINITAKTECIFTY